MSEEIERITLQDPAGAVVYAVGLRIECHVIGGVVCDARATIKSMTARGDGHLMAIALDVESNATLRAVTNGAFGENPILLSGVDFERYVATGWVKPRPLEWSELPKAQPTLGHGPTTDKKPSELTGNEFTEEELRDFLAGNYGADDFESGTEAAMMRYAKSKGLR